jgi:hypothetical protein
VTSKTWPLALSVISTFPPDDALAIGIHDHQQIELAQTQQQLSRSPRADLPIQHLDRVRVVDVADHLVGPGLRLGAGEKPAHPGDALPGNGAAE